MTNQKQMLLSVLLMTTTLMLFGCGGSDSSDTDVPVTEEPVTEDPVTEDPVTEEPNDMVNPDLFLSGALISDVSTEACTLSGGTATTCYRITIAGEPSNAEVGPFCPPSINSDASEGGIWFDGSGELYDVDGNFIVNLPNIYGDGWQLYDAETGLVNVTDTQLACEAAARPDVDPEYQNHCVECSLEYTGGGVSESYLIPVSPVPLSSPAQIRSDVGVALNGVVFANAAPVNAILSNYTIAAFDDCGGHVNPVAGYHYHGSTGCTEATTEADGHASMLGYSMDGYAIYAMLDPEGNEDTDLDECRGHSDDTRGYHYHSASAAENMFIGCFQGEQGGPAND